VINVRHFKPPYTLGAITVFPEISSTVLSVRSHTSKSAELGEGDAEGDRLGDKLGLLLKLGLELGLNEDDLLGLLLGE
jgi:hypothetical protein